MLSRKKLEICGLQTAGNAFKLSILTPPRYFCIILNLLRSHQEDIFGSLGGGGGGGGGGVRAHPSHPPCLRAWSYAVSKINVLRPSSASVCSWHVFKFWAFFSLVFF